MGSCRELLPADARAHFPELDEVPRSRALDDVL